MDQSSGNPPNSETTGWRSLGEIQPSVTGPQPGETGFAVVPTVVSLAEGATVTANDKALQASLRRQCGLSIEVRERLMFPPGGGFYAVPDGVDCRPVGGNAPNPGLALAILERAVEPAPRQVLARELTRLRMLTKAKDRAVTDTEFEALIWMDELSRYPGDVVIEALREWPRQPHGQWWPSWHEMEEVLRRKSAPRRAMLNALRR
ncbi:MAG TPA: hypothetical protein VD994_09500 [Prosthecobacter sp.]|nr:hypothetical protein [Prosthecobacter sp.]